MVKVKICGITNLEDALAAADLGADMLGFNFYEGSKRYVEPAVAAKIINGLDGRIDPVGVFVNADIDTIKRTVEATGLTAVQLHGDETPEFVHEVAETCGTPVIKALRVSPGFLVKLIREFSADSILLDVFSPAAFGGTGERFDWNIAVAAKEHTDRILLAGGLTPKNVAEAVELVRPYAVDVASGVEAGPRKKDAIKIKAFIRNARGI
ncbi:MAG: phosphoribosylanthranilate isomerase [Acidobacteria bacterium]|nr:phosphoribosylanthranilate isomerase [Acidobacteriota bacterium]